MNRLQKIALWNFLISPILVIMVVNVQLNIISPHLVLWPLIFFIIIYHVITSRHYNKNQNTDDYDELENTILLRASHIALIVLFWLALLAFITLEHFSHNTNDTLGITIKHIRVAFFGACGIGLFARATAILAQFYYYQNSKQVIREDDESEGGHV
jgi:heme/copper-type cytochrome/quinol oxidase subunit 2